MAKHSDQSDTSTCPTYILRPEVAGGATTFGEMLALAQALGFRHDDEFCITIAGEALRITPTPLGLQRLRERR